MEEYFVIERNGPQFQLRIIADDDVQGEVLLRLIVLDGEGGSVEHISNVKFLDSEEVSSQIQFERLPNNQLRLTWEGDLQLFSTPDLHQPFQAVPAAASPFDVSMDQNQFYILRSENTFP
ncbi:MAG: hypothetical protein ACFHW5_14925 [Verrucomicrobiota bacterium]